MPRTLPSGAAFFVLDLVFGIVVSAQDYNTPVVADLSRRWGITLRRHPSLANLCDDALSLEPNSLRMPIYDADESH
jgi:hypothetical protein